VTVLITDAKRHRHGHDAAQQCRPEGIEKLLVARQEQDQLVAAPRPEALQVEQDAKGAFVQLAERHCTLLVLALEVGDAAGQRAVRLDQIVESACSGHQRRSSLMCSG
jgi:hypothetical protein